MTDEPIIPTPDPAIDVQLAIAVLDELNAAAAVAGTFSQAFTAERIYLGTPDLAKLSGIRISIVPSESEDTLISRSAVSEEVKISLGIRKKLEKKAVPESPTYSADLAAVLVELDGLRLLTSQIKRHFEAPEHRRLSSMPGAMLKEGAQNKPLYVPEHLDQLGQYTSIIILTYRVAVEA